MSLFNKRFIKKPPIANGKDTIMYKIEMPDGKQIKLWFIGKTLETILKAYNIPYTIVTGDK